MKQQCDDDLCYFFGSFPVSALQPVHQYAEIGGGKECRLINIDIQLVVGNCAFGYIAQLIKKTVQDLLSKQEYHV